MLTFTNIRDTGNASIVKKWTNPNGLTTAQKAELEKNVYFTVKNADGAYLKAVSKNGKYVYNGSQTAEARFMLTNGKFELTELPTGKYTITEINNAEGYLPKTQVKTITVTKDATASVEFVNKVIVGNVTLKNLETYITKSEDATSEKITLVAMSYTPNETVDNVNILFRYYRELQNFYAAMGSETHQLMPEDVFAVLYEYYHPFDNTEFLLPNDIYSRGGSIKDYIAPSMFAFRPKEIEIGNSYTRIMYMARYDRTLDDEFIRDILDNNCKVAVSKHIRHIDKSEAQDKVKDNIYSHQGKIQARLEKNHKKGLNFVPYHWMERERELEDLQERLSDTNCELFKIGVYISLSAATKDELDELTEAIRSKGKKHQVVIDCLVRQQEKALNSVLPFGINHFDTANGNSVNTYVLSDAAGILIPFSARSYFSDTGLCYGMNKHTNAIIVLDRAEEMNANGFILGTSGSGKSMYCKSEIIDTIIRYPKSEKIIIDPDGEYYPIIKQFGGDTLKLSADSETKINIFDTDINISENGTSAVAMKSELIMSIIETARGFPLSAADKSIIDSCVKEVYADYVLNNGNPNSYLRLLIFIMLL